MLRLCKSFQGMPPPAWAVRGGGGGLQISEKSLMGESETFVLLGEDQVILK